MGVAKGGGGGERDGMGERWDGRNVEKRDGGRDVGSVYKQTAMVHVWCSICTLTVSTEWPAVCTHGH